MVGSFLFAVGSFPLYAQVVDPGTVGITFVLGSAFFTAAAVGQLLDAAPTRRDDRLPLWSARVQLVGTVLFNLNTVDAMFASLDQRQTNRLVWAPDVFGSAAFLIASHLAWLVVCHGVVRARDDVDWWVAVAELRRLDLLHAVGHRVVHAQDDGHALNTTIVNTGTFLGAVCFFVGAYLLCPPQE